MDNIKNEPHPVSYDPKTNKWYTVTREFNSWSEALSEAKKLLTNA